MRAVGFDYYETLAEVTVAMRLAVFDLLAAELGLSLAPGELGRRWMHQAADLSPRPFDGPVPGFESFRSRWEVRAEELVGDFGVSGAGPVLARLYADLHAKAQLYPDAAPLIERLRQRFPVGILSDADTDFLIASLARAELRVDAVVCSQEVGSYKPHAAMFWSLCERLGAAPEEVVYVGDNPVTDIEGARRAGLRTIWLNRGSAAWPRELEPPDAEVTSLRDVESLVRTIPD